MKNFILTLFFAGLFIGTSIGQTRFGGGATYLFEGTQFGIQGRAAIDGLMEKADIIPSFTYFLEDGATVMAIDINLAYDLLVIGESIPIYGFGGLDWTRVSIGDVSDSNIGLNLGLGTVVGERIYIEPRWLKLFCDNCGDSFGFNVGYYF